MCEYCKGEFNGDAPIVPLTKNLPVSGIQLVEEGLFLYAYCDCGIHVVTRIHFCPMCGRNLDEET